MQSVHPPRRRERDRVRPRRGDAGPGPDAGDRAGDHTEQQRHQKGEGDPRDPQNNTSYRMSNLVYIHITHFCFPP